MAGDSNFDKVSLLLHGDGANGSTNIIDSSFPKKAISYGSGTVISTAVSKFGGASIAFNGTSSFLRAAYPGVFNLGSGDFVVEFFCYPTTGGATDQYLLQLLGASAQRFYVSRSSSGALSFGFQTGGASPSVNNGSVNAPVNAWTHIALTKTGGNFRVFVGGVSALWISAPAMPAMDCLLEIGAHSTALSNYFLGYLDEVRITKGASRYSGTFTPPTAPFLDYAAQVSGVVRDDTGAPCARTVRLLHRTTGELIGSTTSDAVTGAYTLGAPSLEEVQRIVLDDAGGTLYNDILDRVIPA